MNSEKTSKKWFDNRVCRALGITVLANLVTRIGAPFTPAPPTTTTTTTTAAPTVVTTTLPPATTAAPTTTLPPTTAAPPPPTTPAPRTKTHTNPTVAQSKTVTHSFSKMTRSLSMQRDKSSSFSGSHVSITHSSKPSSSIVLSSSSSKPSVSMLSAVSSASHSLEAFSRSLSFLISHHSLSEAMTSLSKAASFSHSSLSTLSLLIAHHSLSLTTASASLSPSLMQNRSLSPLGDYTNTSIVPLASVLQNPLETIISVEAARAIATSTGVISVVSGLALPGHASTATNLLRMAGCGSDSFNPMLYMPAAPIALGGSDSDLAAINGAIISTTGFMLAIAAVFLVTGALQREYQLNQLKNIHKMFSILLALVISYYGPNVTEIATQSMMDFSVGSGMLAAGALTTWGAAFVSIGYQVYRKVSRDEPSRFDLACFYEPARDFMSKPIRALVLVDMLSSYGLAALSGLKSTVESCAAVVIAMLLVTIGYFVYVAGLRPYQSTIEQGMTTIGALLQVVVASFNVGAIYNPQLATTLGTAQLTALCYAYCQMAVLTAKQGIEWYQKSKEEKSPLVLDVSINQVSEAPINVDVAGSNLLGDCLQVSDRCSERSNETKEMLVLLSDTSSHEGSGNLSMEETSREFEEPSLSPIKSDDVKVLQNSFSEQTLASQEECLVDDDRRNDLRRAYTTHSFFLDVAPNSQGDEISGCDDQTMDI